MSDPYLGQITLVSFPFAPKGWAACNGQLLPIEQNQALFSLLGIAYGGNGVNNFQLPDLRGRTPYGMSPQYPIGQSGGVETVALTGAQIPQHTHSAGYSTQAGSVRNPTGALYGDTGASTPIYASAGGAQAPLNPTTVGTAGQNQPHSNMQPYSVLNFCIALSGTFPSRP